VGALEESTGLKPGFAAMSVETISDAPSARRVETRPSTP